MNRDHLKRNELLITPKSRYFGRRKEVAVDGWKEVKNKSTLLLTAILKVLKGYNKH